MSSFRFVAVAAFATMSGAVSAQPVRPFSMAALKTAQAKGQPVLVEVFAPWCPTCRAQAPTIDALSKGKMLEEAHFRPSIGQQPKTRLRHG